MARGQNALLSELHLPGDTAAEVDYLCNDTNNATIIQQAINSTTTSKTIKFLARTYKPPTSVVINKNNTYIEGGVIDITIFEYSHTNYSYSYIWGCFEVQGGGSGQNVSFKNMTIKYTGTGDGYGIVAQLGQYFIVDFVKVENTNAVIYSRGLIRKAKITNCFLNNTKYGIRIDGGSSESDISNNVIISHSSGGFYGISLNTSQADTITNNKILNHFGYGISIGGNRYYK